MTLRGVFALVVFAILCTCCTDAAYQVNCSGRVISYTDADSLKMAVWKKTIDALSVVYGSKIDLQHIQTLNETIASRMQSAAYDLSNSISAFTIVEKTNLVQIVKKAEELYKRIVKYDLDGFNADIKKIEAILMSLKDESEEVFCMSEYVFVIGDGIQKKVNPIRDQYQEVYDTLEEFRQRAKNYTSKINNRAAQ